MVAVLRRRMLATLGLTVCLAACAATPPAADVSTISTANSPTAGTTSAQASTLTPPAPSPTPMAAMRTATATPSPTAQATSTSSPISSPTPSPTSAPSPTSTLAPLPAPTPVAPAGYEAAMRPSFTGDIAASAALPRYDLAISIDPVQGLLNGTERIEFRNRTGVALNDLALRLYPNFPPDVFGEGGEVRMDVISVAVAGQPVEAPYAARRTAVLVPLAQPLKNGQSITLEVEFRATIRRATDRTWPLPSYYPMLAVHEDSGWRLDVTQFLDHVYAESALYSAEIRAPSTLQIATTGTIVAARPHDDGWTTHSVRSGPVREFAITLGDFAVTQDRGGLGDEVLVSVYTARGSGLDAQAVARVAAAALTDFDQRFGQYPYGELDIHLSPGDYDGGDEFPGLILLYSDAQVDAGTRYVTAHEVAHQWWYGVVGNDIYHEPWLDEAFAQYSAIIYAEDVAGAAVAEADWEREVLRRYRGALADGDLPVGWSLDRYPHFNAYYRTIYGKGAVFLRHLREQLGDEIFFQALRTYHQNHRYGIATTGDLRRAFEERSGQDLEALFQTWVTG